MAIRVLLDHGIKQNHIIFVTFLVARRGGIAHLRRTFPEVHIVTGAVDEGLRELWLESTDPTDDDVLSPGEESCQKAWVIQPGLGQIGECYAAKRVLAPKANALSGDRYYLN